MVRRGEGPQWPAGARVLGGQHRGDGEAGGGALRAQQRRPLATAPRECSVADGTDSGVPSGRDGPPLGERIVSSGQLENWESGNLGSCPGAVAGARGQSGQDFSFPESQRSTLGAEYR